VLLTNRAELPWSPTAIGSVAVIGHNADLARSQGGGSATVLPERVVSPLEGIRDALPEASVSYAIGAVVQEGIAPFPLAQLTNPVTGAPGIRVSFRDADGADLFAEDRRATSLVWFGGDAPIAESATLHLETLYEPYATGLVRLGFAASGTARVYVDDVLTVDATIVPEGTDLGAALLSPPSASAPVEVRAGEAVRIRVEYDLFDRVGPLANAMAFTFGLEPDDADPQTLIDEAVEAAREADVALVVVGTNSRVESEGYDRESLALPGRQDDLVRAVAAVNPRTVVVVNAGSPVLLPWRNEVAAVLVGYFGGQEFGNAIADVLLGTVEPGGRLPTTWPAQQADVPVIETTPTDGVLVYDEGIHIGYRAWLKSGRTPAYPFGHGLGYTSIVPTTISAPASVTPSDRDFTVTVDVANRGARPGKQVVQVYAERPDSTIDRPVRWLVGFASVDVDAGTTASVPITIPVRAFAHWDEGWQYEPGAFTLRIGTSVVELPLNATVKLEA
jgi:beta-glucosidase